MSEDRDLAAELDELRERLEVLEARASEDDEAREAERRLIENDRATSR